MSRMPRFGRLPAVKRGPSPFMSDPVAPKSLSTPSLLAQMSFLPRFCPRGGGWPSARRQSLIFPKARSFSHLPSIVLLRCNRNSDSDALNVQANPFYHLWSWSKRPRSWPALQYNWTDVRGGQDETVGSNRTGLNSEMKSLMYW
jgi:hypothetical protein